MAPPNKHDRKKKPDRPAFNEAALTQLTSKIDKTLSKSHKDEKPEKRKRPDVPERGPQPKKRRRAEGKPERKSGRTDGKKNADPAIAGKITSSELLVEIKALGGDEKDLELVANIDSGIEDELEESAGLARDVKLDGVFRKELAQFASSLGFQEIEREDVSSDEPDHSDRSRDDDSEDDSDVPEPEPVPERPQKQKSAGKLMFEPRPDWHAVGLGSLPPPSPEDIKRFSFSIGNLKAHAKDLLYQDAASNNATQSTSSSQKFLSTIMSSGTQSDKVSALTLAIQESPVHNVKAFESLINLAGKKNRQQAIGALGALVDLLGNGTVLPNDRRLLAFHSQPGLLGSLQQRSVTNWQAGQGLPGKMTSAHLVLWAFEDWLKDAYFRIIQLLEGWCGDEIEYSRSRALDFVFGLLRDKPEQEANLLRLLVNKLGDRDRKIASRASYLLLQLLTLHPGMKAIVIGTIEQEILLRPGQSLRTRYYAITTLNQTILSSNEPAVADTLLRIYFEMFLSLLKSGSLGAEDRLADSRKPEPRKGSQGRQPKKAKRQAADKFGNEQETTQKLVSAVLTGVNRAMPFAVTDESTLETHLDTLFKITHSSNFNTSIQALILIQQLSLSKHLAVDRFYRTLYESLLDPRLISSSKQALYLNLLFRSLKNDVDVRRVKAFVKRMLQVVHLHQPSFVCGILYLVAELNGTFPDLKTLLNMPEDGGADAEEIYEENVEESLAKGDAASQKVNGSTERRRTAYDGRKRAPEYSNADQSCLWELVPFFHHFHPSVAVFATNLLVRQKSLPKPELANHTLMHFLDKFVYRSPKTTETRRGGSIMQPVLAGGSSAAAHVVIPGKAGAQRQSVVNSAAFWNLKLKDVAAEDVFFHEYFAQVGKPGQAKKAKKAKADEDRNAVAEDEEEEEIWQALVSSRPEVLGDEEGDSDLDMDGLEGSDVSLDLGSDGEEEGFGSDDMESQGSDAGFSDIFGDSDKSDVEEQDDKPGSEEERTEKEAKRSKARQRRKELKALPTFASAEDYAEMLAGEEDF